MGVGPRLVIEWWPDDHDRRREHCGRSGAEITVYRGPSVTCDGARTGVHGDHAAAPIMVVAALMDLQSHSFAHDRRDGRVARRKGCQPREARATLPALMHEVHT